MKYDACFSPLSALTNEYIHSQNFPPLIHEVVILIPKGVVQAFEIRDHTKGKNSGLSKFVSY